MLQLENLSKTYAKGKVKAVDGLDLEVKDGEIFGFLGPNGAGKSTTIKMITGILQPDEGQIVLNGVSLKKEPYVFKHNIGYVPDNHATYDKLTGMEYLNFMGSMYDVPLDLLKERAQQFVEKFGLADAINDQIKSYSHGMQQKLVVIGSLLHDPKLWILDEPLTGLDPQSAYELKIYMRERADNGRTVFFSSHVLDVVEKVCDRVGIIKGGKLIAVGTMDELRAHGDSLEEFFLSVMAKDPFEVRQ